MSPVMIQILFYMTATFVLGLVLGWLLWRYNTAQEVSGMQSERDFWKKNLEQERHEREHDANMIEALRQERESLKKRLAAATKKPQ